MTNMQWRRNNMSFVQQPSQNANGEQPLNFQIPPKGYDSYLEGILPDDQAVLAGAFATSMMQIKNIQQVKLKDFAQVAYNNETTFGLPGVGGSDVPVDLQLAQIAQTLTALGSGVYGTFTMSNFFGCMSGLPYPLRDIYNGIKELETEILKQIYKNLYLAVQWEQATATVVYTEYTGPGPAFETYYHVTGVTIDGHGGGGYLRDGAAEPTITFSNGATATLTLGTDPKDVGSNGTGTYGRVTTSTLTSSGTDTTSEPTATITAPPGPGWPGMDSIVQDYINDANDEIEAIENASPANFRQAQILDTNWNITGIALKHEQRARYIAIPPVPVPWDRWLTNYPVALYTFTDSVPQLAQNTLPHMSAQTLEHISDLDLAGGQSMIALMRQERNQVRMGTIGVGLDNNLSDSLPPEQQIELMTDGVLAGAVEGINGYTLPAWPEDSEPLTVFDPDLPGLRYVEETDDGTIEPLIDITIEDIPIEGTPPVLVNGILRQARPPTVIVNPKVPVVQGVPVQSVRPPSTGAPTLPDGSPPDGTPITGLAALQPVNQPDYILQPTIETLPPTLRTNNTGTTLYPATYDIPSAIDKVVECNCDCWVY